MGSQSQSEAVPVLSSDQPSQHLDDEILSIDAYHLAHTIFPRLIEYLGSTISFPFVSIQDGFQLLSVDRAVWSKTADRLTSLSFVTDAEELVERSALAAVGEPHDEIRGGKQHADRDVDEQNDHRGAQHGIIPDAHHRPTFLLWNCRKARTCVGSQPVLASQTARVYSELPDLSWGSSVHSCSLSCS